MKNIFIISLFTATFFFSGCGENEKEVEKASSLKVVVTEEKNVEKTPEAKLVDQVKDSASTIADKIVEESKKVAETLPDAVKSVSEKVVVKTKEISNDVVAVAGETKKKIEKEITTVVDSAKNAMNNNEQLLKNGKNLYARCASCHGANAQNPALGKSQIIKGWEKSKIIEALNGYKNDTYGGAMKTIMKGQVTNLNDEDIESLAIYINSL